MRDRADADLHLLVTREATGSGGGRYTLEFIGLKNLAGRVDTLSYTSRSDDTNDVIRRGLTRTIKLGLVPFVANTMAGAELDVVMPANEASPAAGEGTTSPENAERDPWDFWTFSVSLNGFTSGESQQGWGDLFSNISANRTTEQWKINLGVNNSYSESRYEYTLDGVTRKTTSISRSYGANGLVVRSLGNHLSAGLRASASSSTFANNELSVSFAPAVEYNFVPYSEMTRRSLLLQYSVGARHARYREETLFGEMEETRPIQTASLGYATRQPWGSINIGVDASQYLHDTQKYNARIGGSTSLRLVRGLSFNVGGSYRLIRDQLSLPRRELSEEEVLLRQRQLATSYSYSMNFGLSYRFGSIFNNVVNPRFGGGGGGGEVIMIM